MSSEDMQPNIPTRHCIQEETEMLVRQVASYHRPILLQTDDGMQALLMPFDAEQASLWTMEWRSTEREAEAQLLTGD